MCEFKDKVNRVAAVAIGGERANEGAIDFDFVERPATKPGERAESGAEVAEAQSNAEALDVGEGFGSGGEVRNSGRLGDFELERGGCDAGVLNRRAQVSEEVAVSDLAR